MNERPVDCTAGLRRAFSAPRRIIASDMKGAARSLIAAGSRVRVVQGRQFQNFGAGDSGVVVRADKDAGTCDVAFDGREGRMTVATRYLEVDPASTAKPPVASQGPAAPTTQLLEERLGAQRPRASSNDSSATDPNGRVLEGDPRPPPILSASGGPPDRPSPHRAAQPPPPHLRPAARGVAEVLHDVRRVREAHRRGAATLQGAADVRGEGATVALSEAVQASASATAAATANAMTEVGCLRQAFSELRELILLEAEQRVAGLREVHDGLEQVRAGHSPHGAGSESLLRAEQRRLEQKQAELVSLCASLQTLKEQHSESLASPHGGQADWELSVQLPLTARLNSLDARLVVMDERLSLLGGQVSSLADARGVQLSGPSQALSSGWEQPVTALGARVEALVQGEAQRNACLGQLQARFASEVEQAQQALRAETGRLSAQLRSAATEVLGKAGGDAAGLLKAQADAERDRSAKLLESLQARLDALSEGLAAEARKREAAVAHVEAHVRRACGEVERRAPVMRAASANTAAIGDNGSYCKAAPEKPQETRILTAADRPLEPRVAALEPRAAQTEKYAGQTLASLAMRLPSAERAHRRLRAELGSSSSGAGSPRLEKPPTAASLAVAGAAQPRTPRSSRPAGGGGGGGGGGCGGGSEQEAEVATATPGSTATTTAACVGEEATAPAPAASAAAATTTTRVLRMESSPVRQKSAPQATVATQRSILRGGLVGVDLNHTGRADLLVSGLDLNADPLHSSYTGPASAPQPQAQVVPGAITPSPPITTTGALVMPSGNLMSPSVPMMPVHMGNVPGNLPGQPGISGAPAGGLMWPSALPPSPPSFGPLAPGAFLQPRM